MKWTRTEYLYWRVPIIGRTIVVLAGVFLKILIFVYRVQFARV